jgi:hypothetical protein
MKTRRRIKPIPPAPRPWWHEVIGRAALGVIALAFLWGGWKCVRTSLAIQRDYEQRSAAGASGTRSGGSGLPMAIGIVLFVMGTPVAIATVAPVTAIEKLLGRQTNNTLWENPEPGRSLGAWDAFL